MEVLEFAPYVFLMVGVSALVGGAIPLGKYIHHKYIESQNRRIDGCIEIKTMPYVKRINKLEYQFKILKTFFIPKEKLSLLEYEEE